MFVDLRRHPDGVGALASADGTLRSSPPSTPLWLLIRLVLLVVGVAARCSPCMLVRLARRGPATAWLAVFAFFFFWLQTMVLDALVWPHYYSIGS